MKKLFTTMMTFLMSSLVFATDVNVVREVEGTESEKEERIVCEKDKRRMHKQPVKKTRCKADKD
jgi:hypothetical protein